MLSIIIVGYDQHELTTEHVKWSMAGTKIPDEIIVVNDGGDPSLLEMLKKLEKKTKIIYARITEDIDWNYHGAINLGLFISRGDFIGMEDTDHIAYPDFYEKAVAELENGYNCVVGKNRSFIKKADVFSLSMTEWKPYRSAGCHSRIGVYTRDIFIKMKGVDERFVGHYGWDGTDMLRRLDKVGVRRIGVSGFYMVSDGLSREGNRPMIGTKFKMEKENAWQLHRNIKEGGQVGHPIINFNFDYENL